MKYILSLLFLTLPSLTLACQPITSSSLGVKPWDLIIAIITVVCFLLLRRYRKLNFTKSTVMIFTINIIVFIITLLWLYIGLGFFISNGLIRIESAGCEFSYHSFYGYLHPFIETIFSMNFIILIISSIVLIILGALFLFKKMSALKYKK